MEELSPIESRELVTSPLALVASPPANNDMDGGDDSDTSNDEIDVEKRNRELQTFFEQKMDKVGNKRSHSNVAVLLISWEPEGEDYIDAGAEVSRRPYALCKNIQLSNPKVDRLEAVFKNRYDFTVRKRRLHTLQGKPARNQMNLHLAQFVLDEDGQDTLLIIYYAGHGIRNIKPGELTLVGGNPKNGNKGLNQIVWNEAEHQLMRTDADLFVIFDCCYAGQLAISTRSIFSSKIFEFLGATQAHDVALAPGDESFSTALAWALENLATQPDGFTTLQLEQKIKQAPQFPSKTQVPCLTTRGEASLRRLKIAPLPKEPGEPGQKPRERQREDVETIKYYLQLQLLFSSCPDETHVKDLTENLKDLVRGRNLPLRQVLWRGLFSRDTAKIDKMDLVTVVARNWYHRTRNSKSLSGSAKANSASVTVFQQHADSRRGSPPALEGTTISRSGSPSLQARNEAAHELDPIEKFPAQLDPIQPRDASPRYILIDRRNWNWVLPTFLISIGIALGYILSDYRIVLPLSAS